MEPAKTTIETALAPRPAGAAAVPARVGGQIDYERFLDCVHCGLCTAACPTYLETGDENNGPRGRIYLMRAVVDGRVQLSAAVERHLDLCLDCRACETACPSGVQYGRLIEPFRESQRRAQAAVGKAPNTDWFHRLILYGLFPHAGRMRAALAPARWMQRLRLDRLLERMGLVRLLPPRLRRMYRLLPRLAASAGPLPEFLPAVGRRRARVALFRGCVADAVFRHVHWATARVLAQNGCDVVVPRKQVCCGAIHYHSGAALPALDLARANAAAFAAADVDAIVVNVAGCGSMLKDYAHLAHEVAPDDQALREALERCAGKMRDVSEFLAGLGLAAPTGELPLRAVYQDACHLAHAQKIREAPRALLAAIPGLKIQEIAEPEVCCGAAGSYNLTEPEMSDRLAARKLANVLAADPQVIVSANAGCSMQLQAALAQSGRRVWVAHPMELLDLSYRGEAPPKW
jgi:glycolate oxidase iron-sulfur subunit